MTLARGPRKLLGQCAIDARKRWNRTGIVLEAGKRYDFEAAGGESWRDGNIVCGADGYECDRLRLFARLRRVPFARWLALIGALGSDGATLFPIGRAMENYIPLRSGELYCFANDVWFMYWNNAGSVELTVYERHA